ncbi:hypothetical protein JK358_30245 [Nocardia sp. 2]|uniref:DUF11 domain-containing protein n=1 Tax=Nocardia acididurans TaxID=2802282 RepID=A0ABS1MDJ9_9NOCA|nr:hypothetical protein [Nocardia acididurans]MBL1078692.1 hypothetical protein [Nocardia acididurans]
MFRNPRTTALAASASLILAGLSVGLNAGVATADSTCSVRSYETKKDWSTVGVTHTYEKIATSDTIGLGTTVTYKIVVGTTGIGNPYVNTITDFPPTGLGAPVKTTITAYHLGGGQRTEDVTPTPNAGGWKVTSTGWFVNSGNPVTMTITYPVPDNLGSGKQVTSGGVGVAGTVGVGNEMPNLTACFTTRGANAGETVIGSLGDNGLGSNDGQLSSTGSFSDIIADALRKYLGS